MGCRSTKTFAVMAAMLLGLFASAAPAAHFGLSTAKEVEQGFVCAQHGFCTGCLEASSRCTWCPKDHRCYGIGGSLFTSCGKPDEIQNASSCPAPRPPRTNFSLNLAHDMAQHAHAAYSDHPSSQVLPPGFRLKSTFNYTLGIWSTAFGYVGINERMQRVVLAFRGSKTYTQLTMEILKHNLVDYPGQPGSKVHAYFLQADLGIRPIIRTHIQELTEQCPGCTIHITGHSLGGAMAVLAAFWLRETHNEQKVSVYTFGQPRVGNYALSVHIDSRLPEYYRIINAADIVPHIPSCNGAIPRPFGSCVKEPLNYWHGGMEIWFPRGDYKDGFMCGYRECIFNPLHEDMACSNGLLDGGFEGSISDHLAYWMVIPPHGYCGVPPETPISRLAGTLKGKAVAADTIVV
mmetsp:Transcript_22729/g.51993  ORF Transcript_22729/g.51993 Transcript_22729/m.51993 type:complete len:404 (-) Transcript_22729:194-1405(-)|eukprot:CAMPEP_0197897066 /NCGR_PEP_ID=MMETSP1439-20131203/41559_1 /TAXON_ID=66791 /ORGANISM="Gonyaulax spinifera, Strain CCMP409" /LENGTH=403 /DNA_ID=CAMNT_0043517665 /DNA_START=61 /DNA_END=1272 /DNA_ORIENTATION=-